jgi:hypothetical protein
MPLRRSGQGMELIGTYQLLVYAHDVNILDENVINIKRNTVSSVKGG